MLQLHGSPGKRFFSLVPHLHFKDLGYKRLEKGTDKKQHKKGAHGKYLRENKPRRRI
jgi:hypothetical protein